MLESNLPRHFVLQSPDEVGVEESSMQVPLWARRESITRMRTTLACLVTMVTLVFGHTYVDAASQDETSVSSAAIIVDPGEVETVTRVAEVLRTRLERRSNVPIEMDSRPAKNAGLVVYLGGNRSRLLMCFPPPATRIWIIAI